MLSYSPRGLAIWTVGTILIVVMTYVWLIKPMRESVESGGALVIPTEQTLPPVVADGTPGGRPIQADGEQARGESAAKPLHSKTDRAVLGCIDRAGENQKALEKCLSR